MGSLVMIIYLLLLVFSIIYFAKVVYKNYQKGLPFQCGQNRVVSICIISCLAIGQFLVTSIKKRIIIFLVFLLLVFLLYTIIDHHNQVNHSEDLFLFFQKEIRREKRYICIGIGVLLIILLIVCFME